MLPRRPQQDASSRQRRPQVSVQEGVGKVIEYRGGGRGRRAVVLGWRLLDALEHRALPALHARRSSPARIRRSLGCQGAQGPPQRKTRRGCPPHREAVGGPCSSISPTVFARACVAGGDELEPILGRRWNDRAAPILGNTPMPHSQSSRRLLSTVTAGAPTRRRRLVLAVVRHVLQHKQRCKQVAQGHRGREPPVGLAGR